MLSENTGKDLLNEMKWNSFSLYNTQQLFKLRNEQLEVEGKIDELKNIASSGGVTTELSINFALLRAYNDRLTRIEKAYHWFRLQRVMDNYFVKNNIKNILSTNEIEFERKYGKLCDKYFKDYKHIGLIDRSPPLEYFVQIITLQDCGMILCSNEMIELKKNTIYFLKKSDIIHLICKNKVEII